MPLEANRQGDGATKCLIEAISVLIDDRTPFLSFFSVFVFDSHQRLKSQFIETQHVMASSSSAEETKLAPSSNNNTGDDDDNLQTKTTRQLFEEIQRLAMLYHVIKEHTTTPVGNADAFSSSLHSIQEHVDDINSEIRRRRAEKRKQDYEAEKERKAAEKRKKQKPTILD